MTDGVVDIPLPGIGVQSGVGEPGGPMPYPFLAGPEHRLVEVAIRSASNHQADDYNPLVFFGPSGTGKSHVALGLSELWKSQHRKQRVLYTTAVDFARELADAIDSQAVEEFRVKYRTAGMLVCEDVGQLTGGRACKLNAQEEFIHTLDALVSERHWVVVTASAAPAELPGLLPGLQSRLTAGLCIEMPLPGAETRLAFVRRLAALRNIALSDRAARALAAEMQSTASELIGALTQLAAASSVQPAQVDLADVTRYLAQRTKKRQPELQQIAQAASRYFGLSLGQLRSPARQRTLVIARGVIIYLARCYAGLSFQQIGEYLGGRDHTTIMHGYRQTEKHLSSEPVVYAAVASLRKTLWKT